MKFNKITENTTEPIYTYNNVKYLQDNYIPVEEAIRIKDDLEKEKDNLDSDIYNYFDTIINRSIALFSEPIGKTITSEPGIGTKIYNYIATDKTVGILPGIQYPNEVGIPNFNNKNSAITNNRVQNTNKTDKFRELLKQMADIHDAKNAAYGDSFGQSIKNYGLIAALTRISDKFHRFENLVLHPEAGKGVTDESRKDTLLDMANYCIMTYLAMEAEK